MLLRIFISLALISVASAQALLSSSQILLSRSSLAGAVTGSSEATSPTGSYASLTSTITAPTPTNLLGSTGDGATMLGAANVTSYVSISSQIILQGSATTINGTNPTESQAPPQPTNTTPCNNYPEFCSRQYSNITEVSAHNSPFAIANNIASNQHYPVTAQLNDGIRLLQAQMHFVNGVPHFCHTSCDLLDAGPITIWLAEVYEWVLTHPYDIITLILENGDYTPVESYVPFINSTGITKFLYIPPKIPMNLSDWPTLESMILQGKRVVLFMDYKADQLSVPWILDEFSQLWETQFDQTNRSFPCDVQRPPDLSLDQTKERMYMTNHNLNYEIDLLGNAILVPYLPLLNVTNGVDGFGSLGKGVEDCVAMWNRPPRFLDVDFYDVGGGSVFQVAAKWNGVNYNRTCCGGVKSRGARTLNTRAIWVSGTGTSIALLIL